MSNDDPLCEALRGVLVAVVESGPGATGGMDSIQSRVCATLYALLVAHPVDRRGRCRSCRRRGAVLGLRRRRCRVRGEARFWLQQPAEFLRSRLVSELGLPQRSPGQHSATLAAAGGGLGDTDVVPRTELDPSDPHTEPVQTPAVSPPLPPRSCPRAGRSDPDHGETGVPSDGPRSRRDPPPDDPSPGPGESLLLTEPTTAEPTADQAGGMARPGPADALCVPVPQHLEHDNPGMAR